VGVKAIGQRPAKKGTNGGCAQRYLRDFIPEFLIVGNRRSCPPLYGHRNGLLRDCRRSLMRSC
jgi:hypothetical protein